MIAKVKFALFAGLLLAAPGRLEAQVADEQSAVAGRAAAMAAESKDPEDFAARMIGWLGQPEFSFAHKGRTLLLVWRHPVHVAGAKVNEFIHVRPYDREAIGRLSSSCASKERLDASAALALRGLTVAEVAERFPGVLHSSTLRGKGESAGGVMRPSVIVTSGEGAKARAFDSLVLTIEGGRVAAVNVLQGGKDFKAHGN